MNVTWRNPFQQEATLKIYGVVFAIEWDENNEAKRFIIFSRNGQEYYVDNNRFNEKLREGIHREVEAIGHVVTDESDERKIWLKKLKILNGPSAPKNPVTWNEIWWQRHFNLATRFESR